MDAIRQERFLNDLRARYDRALVETCGMSEAEWDRLRCIGIEEALSQMTRLSTASREYRQMREAIVLLFPYREAWEIIAGYEREILEAPPSEQNDLLERTITVIAEHTRMPVQGIVDHIYAFWPVRAYVLGEAAGVR